MARKMTKVSSSGLIHRLVPVKPLCPNEEPTGNTSPRGEEYAV